MWLCLWSWNRRPLVRALSKVAARCSSCGRVSNCKLNSKPPACGFNCGLADWQTNRSHWRCGQTHRQLLVYHIPPASVTSLPRRSSLHYVTWIKLRAVFLTFFISSFKGLKMWVIARVLLLSVVSWLHSLVFKSVWPQCVSSCSVCVCVCVCVFIHPLYFRQWFLEFYFL